jgi:hypothetical protein
MTVEAADTLAGSQAKGGVGDLFGGEILSVLMDDQDAIATAEHRVVFVGAGAMKVRTGRNDGVFLVIVIAVLVVDINGFREAGGGGAEGGQQYITSWFGHAMMGAGEGLAGYAGGGFQRFICEQFHLGHDGVGGIAVIEQGGLFTMNPEVGGRRACERARKGGDHFVHMVVMQVEAAINDLNLIVISLYGQNKALARAGVERTGVMVERQGAG